MTQTVASKAKEIIKQPTTSVTFRGEKSGTVLESFNNYKAQIAQAIPKHLTVDRIIQLATTMVSRSPEIAECSKSSVIGAVMQASILGFEPVQSLGQAYFVPFNNTKNGKREVQFIIGYRGMIELARRSGQIKTIYAQVVYKNDEFSYEYGLDPKLYHKPALEERGKMTHVYAVAVFVNGGFAFEVMSKADVEKIKDSSKAAKTSFSPWNTFYDEMAKKTVLRRLWKILPSSVDTIKVETTDGKVIEADSFMQGGDINPNKVNEVEFADDYEIVSTEATEPAEEVEQSIFDKIDSKGNSK